MTRCVSQNLYTAHCLWIVSQDGPSHEGLARASMEQIAGCGQSSVSCRIIMVASSSGSFPATCNIAGISLVPRPFRRRKGLVHIASACAGGPQKKLGESDTIVYSPFIIHRTARHAKSVSDHHGNATGHYGDASACARNVYQALLSPPEGPGYEAMLGSEWARGRG